MGRDRDIGRYSKERRISKVRKAMRVTTDITVKSSARLLSGIFTEEKSMEKTTQRLRTEKLGFQCRRTERRQTWIICCAYTRMSITEPDNQFSP